MRVKMDDKGENMVWSASQGLIAVAVVASITILPVTILQVALILLLVDPIDDVVMATI